MDRSEVIENTLTETPVRATQSSTERPPSSRKKPNSILNKLFCSSDNVLDCGASNNSNTSPPTYGSHFLRPMKTPSGFVIPTPYIDKKELAEFNEMDKLVMRDVLSPRNDHNVMSSPLAASPSKLDFAVTTSSSMVVGYGDVVVSVMPITTKTPASPPMAEIDDETAFLPDDIREQLIQHASSKDINKENNPSTSQSVDVVPVTQVQARIDAALEKARLEWNEEMKKELEKNHKAAFEALETDAEQQLVEHAKQWNFEHEEELEELRKDMQAKMDRQREQMQMERQEAERTWNNATETERTATVDQIFALVYKAQYDARERDRRTREVCAEQAATNERLQKMLRAEQAQEIERLAREHQELLVQKESILLHVTEEKNGLLERVATLESANKMLEQENNVAKQSFEQEMERLKEEAQTTLTVATKQLTAASESESNRLRDTIAQLESAYSQLEKRLSTTTEAHKAELQRQQDEFEDHLGQEKEAFLTAQSMASEAMTELAGKVEMFKASLSHERQTFNLERQSHIEKIDSLQKAKDDLQNELEGLRRTTDTERQALKAALESKEQEAQCHDSAIQRITEQVEKQRQDFAKEREKIVATQQTSSDKERELNMMVAVAVKEREEYASKLQQVQEQQKTEIEDILRQLDLVEAEHKQKEKAHEESIKQKEAIIAALGTQLADAISRTKALEAQREQDVARLSTAVEERDFARTELKSLQVVLDRLRGEHMKALEEERSRRDDAVKEKHAEVVAQANEQFAVAKKQHLNLKQEYDLTMKKLVATERELKSSRRELEHCRKEQMSIEVELKAEIAHIKAVLATGEADSAKKAKAHANEAEAMRTAQNDLQEKLDAAISERNSVRDNLAFLVTEKDKLAKEHAEIKSVCEELMAMMEGNQK